MFTVILVSDDSLAAGSCEEATAGFLLPSLTLTLPSACLNEREQGSQEEQTTDHSLVRSSQAQL